MKVYEEPLFAVAISLGEKPDDLDDKTVRVGQGS